MINTTPNKVSETATVGVFAPLGPDFAREDLFDAYLQGGLKWPQLRAGSNICMLPILLSLTEAELKVFFRCQLSPEQIEKANRLMEIAHKAAGVTLSFAPPEDRLQAEWDRARAFAAQSLALVSGRLESERDALINIAVITRQVVLSARLLSKMFTLSFYRLDKREDENIVKGVMALRQYCRDFGWGEEVVDSPQKCRAQVKASLISEIKSSVDAHHLGENLTWILGDLFVP